MKKRIILKRLLLSTAVLTVASTAIIVQQHSSVDKTVKTEECSKQDVVSSSSEAVKSEAKPSETKAEEKPATTESNLLAEKPVETKISVAQTEVKPAETVAIKEVETSQCSAAKLVKTPVVETKPTEQKKTETPVKQNEKPASQTKVEKPADVKTVEQPKVEVPAESKSARPTKVETPAVEKPAETKPISQPKVEKPKTEAPTTSTPKVEQPATPKPAEQPVEKPVATPAPQPKVEAPVAETPKAEQPVVAEKGEALVQPELPEFHDAKGTPEVQPALPEATVPVETPQPEQPVVPEAPVVTEKGEPLIQPELPEYHEAKGEPEVQPELPEFHEERGEPLVQPTLPEATVPVETPQPEQPVAPEAPVVTEKGEPLVQPELPEFHYETGEALVQPELPEYHEQKGEPEVQPTLPEFKLKTVSREETIKISAETMNVPNSELNEGETEIVTQPKDGSITRTYEDILDEHDNVLSTKLVNETRVEAIKGVTSIGTKPVKKVFGEEGNYRFSEHLADENILEFREDVKLTADEIHALGQDEINKRVEQNLENTITVQDKTRPNVSSIDSAPLSDETITKLNSDTYINHKNIGLKVLELVNAERKRLGVHELTWSDPLYTLTKVRANEVRENGSIRFYTEDGQALKHVRDNKGTKWHTVKEGTEFEDSAMGENLASYGIRPNIYKAFSEKYIAEQLYEQWKDSPHHYANMIKEKFNQFAFDVAYSTFWRDGYNDVNYKQQGVLGVQLFAD